MTAIPYLISKNSITVMVNGVTHTVNKDQPNHAALLEAVRNKQWDAVPALITPARAVEMFGAGAITVVNGEVLYNGEVLRNGVTQRILDMISQGFDAQPLINFLSKLMLNPSKTAVDELYDWLEGTSLPITEDGDFMAYKKVRDDYRDFYTGKMLNSVGENPSMPRNQVDDDRSRTCSQGLHFCSLSYLPCYHGGSGRVMLVKVNPANVVSIPNDYDFAKGRAWTYTVVGEHVGDERTEAFTTAVVNNQGEPTPSPVQRARNTEAAFTVMGVNFVNQARADLVRALLSAVGTRDTTTGRTEQQGRVDGFDAAWFGRELDLTDFGGSNQREAVAYARAYFEGYDRCTKASGDVAVNQIDPRGVADGYACVNDQQRAEVVRVLNLPLGVNTLNHGTRAGGEDGAYEGDDDRLAGCEFDLSTVEDAGGGYRQAYIRAYLSSYNTV